MNLNVTSFYTEINSFLFPPTQRNWQVMMNGSKCSFATAEITEKMTVLLSPVSSPPPSLPHLCPHRTEMRLKSSALSWPALFLCHTLLCWALSPWNQSKGDTYVVWKPCSIVCPKGCLSLCTKRKSCSFYSYTLICLLPHHLLRAARVENYFDTRQHSSHTTCFRGRKKSYPSTPLSWTMLTLA